MKRKWGVLQVVIAKMSVSIRDKQPIYEIVENSGFLAFLVLLYYLIYKKWMN